MGEWLQTAACPVYRMVAAICSLLYVLCNIDYFHSSYRSAYELWAEVIGFQ